MKFSGFSRLTVALAILVTMALAAPSLAQLDDDSSSAIQFNFSPPGARSLGLGGAFLAVADDATAAFTNPAGLVILREREVFAEVRQVSSATPFVNNGAGEFSSDGRSVNTLGTATGFGTDTLDGLRFGETDDESTGLSFVSFVQPIGDFRIAFYRHELVNFETQFESQGAFVNFAGGTAGARLFPVRSSVELDVENFGVSFAYKFSETFSLGVGLSYYQFDVAGLTNRFDIITTDIRFFDPPNFASGNVATTQAQSGDDDDMGLNFGFLWSPTSKFSLGGAYREGGEFEYTYSVGTNVASPTFNVPTVYGVGLAVRPTAALTISFDVNEIEYSSLVEDFTTLLAGNSPELFEIEDGTELRLGIEYRFLNMANPITIRAGGWEDPAHQITRRNNGAATAFDSAELLQQALWAASVTADDETHYSFGLGFTFGENFALDIGGDFSDRTDIAAASAVVRF